MKKNIVVALKIFTFLFLLACSISCSSTKNIELKKDYDFSTKETVSVYIIPSNKPKLDDTFLRVITLDLKSRGYKVININILLLQNNNRLYSYNHRTTADSLISNKSIPQSDIYLVAKPNWDSVYFAVEQLPRTLGGKRLFPMRGLNVLRLFSEIALFDSENEEPILSFTALDTTHLYTDESGDDLFYPEFPWMICARQLTREFAVIPLCSVIHPVPSKNKLEISFWVDNSYRHAFPKTWKDRITRRVLYANDILCSQFDIQLVIKDFKEWDTQFEKSLKHSLRKLQREEKSKNIKYRIGVTLNKDIKTNWTDKSQIGLAVLGGKDAVITAQPSYPGLGFWNSLEESITLVHEIGHLLGAKHVDYPSSIMYPSHGHFSYEFDPYNYKIVKKSIDEIFE